jgi:hypothetical protein
MLPSIEFTGFDPAANAIDLANVRSPECSFFVGDVLDTGTYPLGSYDLAIIRGVLHHLPEQRAAICNVSKVSRRILIIEPNGNNPILKWIEKNSVYHIQHEEQSFSSQHLQELCVSCGLECTHVSFVGFIPFFFPTLPARIIHFFQPLLEKVPGLAKRFGGQIILLAEKTEHR